MKHSPVIFLLLLLILLTVTGCGREDKAAGGEIKINPEPPTVRRIEVFGRVKATVRHNLSLDFPVRVVEVFVREGQKVTAGGSLLALDFTDYHNRLQNLNHQLALAHLELQLAEKEVALLKNKLAVEIEKYRQFQAELETNKVLAQKGALSLRELEEFQRFTEEQELIVNELCLSLAALGYPPEEYRDQNFYPVGSIQAKEEKINLLAAELRALEGKIQYGFIRDNLVISEVAAGAVYELPYGVGDIILANERIISLVDLDSLIIEADVAEEFIKEINLGDPATVHPLADYSREYPAVVTEIAKIALRRQAETIIPVRLRLEEVDDFLLPNFNVDVIFVQEP